MKEYQVVVVGDAIMDVFILPQKDSEHFHVNREKGEISFSLGAKIPVDTAVVSIGGNGTNVSSSLSKLGIRTTLVAEMGDDNFAQIISKELAENRISLEYLVKTKNAPSTFSVIISIGEERTIFSHHIERKHDFNFSPISAEWMYLTSLGEVWHDAYQRAFSYIKEKEVRLAFNPGSHQLAEGSKSFLQILPHTEIFFINREEAEHILFGQDYLGDEKRKSVEDILHAVQRLGPKIVSITDGTHGSYACDETGKTYFQDTLPSLIVEKTGVGDAYAAGFLGAIINNCDVPTAMRWGAANSAAVMEQVGATKGLPTKEELIKRIG